MLHSFGFLPSHCVKDTPKVCNCEPPVTCHLHAHLRVCQLHVSIIFISMLNYLIGITIKINKVFLNHILFNKLDLNNNTRWRRSLTHLNPTGKFEMHWMRLPEDSCWILNWSFFFKVLLVFYILLIFKRLFLFVDIVEL